MSVLLLYHIIPLPLKSLLVYGLSELCGQREHSHILGGKNSKMGKPDSGYLQEIPPESGRSQTIPTGSTSIVQPRGKAS
jgi:hypothetical protein